MSDEATQYYFALFFDDSLPAENEENMILSYIPSLVTNVMNESLMRLISLLELEEVVFGIRKGKALGLDGLPFEFF